MTCDDPKCSDCHPDSPHRYTKPTDPGFPSRREFMEAAGKIWDRLNLGKYSNSTGFMGSKDGPNVMIMGVVDRVQIEAMWKIQQLGEAFNMAVSSVHMIPKDRDIGQDPTCPN